MILDEFKDFPNGPFAEIKQKAALFTVVTRRI